VGKGPGSSPVAERMSAPPPPPLFPGRVGKFFCSAGSVTASVLSACTGPPILQPICTRGGGGVGGGEAANILPRAERDFAHRYIVCCSSFAHTLSSLPSGFDTVPSCKYILLYIVSYILYIIYRC
jgi:hypothetical protein